MWLEPLEISEGRRTFQVGAIGGGQRLGGGSRLGTFRDWNPAARGERRGSGRRRSVRGGGGWLVWRLMDFRPHDK